MYSRPTTTQPNLWRRLTFVSNSCYLFLLLILHLQKCLKAPGPVTTVTPDQPHEAPGPVTPCTVTPDQPHTATIVEMFSFSSIYLYLHLQEYLEAPGPDTACNTRPTTIGNLSRRPFLYISLFNSAFSLSRNTLKLQALIPLVTPDQPQSATCRDVLWFVRSIPTNLLSNFSRYAYQKSLRSHTSKHSSHWQSAPSLYLQTQPYGTTRLNYPKNT